MLVNNAILNPAGDTERPDVVKTEMIIVCPNLEASPDVQVIVRDALPEAACLICTSAHEALRAAQQVRFANCSIGVYLFDFRGQPLGDLTSQLQQIYNTDASSEIVVVTESHDVPNVIACLQIAPSTERLTFLLSPLSRRRGSETLRALCSRVRLQTSAAQAFAMQRQKIKQMEVINQELTARLDVAVRALRHDPLTGLPNRVGFMEEITARLRKIGQHQNIIIVDLDRFKTVNDTLGHAAGDELVKKIGLSIASIMPNGSVLARLGGDEFGILVEAMSEAGLEALCIQIQKACNRSRIIAGDEVQVTASIGIARQGGNFAEVELMRQADLALHAAKRDGRNNIRLFDQQMDTSRKYRLSLEGGMERGLIAGQFHMVYQPIVDAADGQILACEALVRWNSPDFGPVPPSEFIPIAEETGLILDLGDWISRQALKDCRRGNFPAVSINLSVRQFLRHNVGERILRYAADANVAPDRIQIELTETAIIDDVDRAAKILTHLRSAGVKIALDDFGTGYSSLVYLNRFALDCIKIDKSFVEDIDRDRQSAIIVASVTKLAESLGMKVVAEGVETEAQRKILIACGCQIHQGYLFGAPVSAKEMNDMLLRNSAQMTN